MHKGTGSLVIQGHFRRNGLQGNWELVWTKPMPWGQLSDEAKGALLLAYHEGKALQILQSEGNWYNLRCGPMWKDMSTYRVKPEPEIKTGVVKTATVKFSGQEEKRLVEGSGKTKDGVPFGIWSIDMGEEK